MAICLKCGVILNDADINKHICEVADIPAAGQMKKPTTTTTGVK